eukprot:TRINITY_DN3849_c0_g1_i1.p1 TRINITY_DN3849_c0_g1~~TRINITY_DN3849_c0_g1_i1.p1  ORF type:complete len:114 (+),score=23.53 TRINITY_DN3849_c0_g1_i1:113-454(+)
MATALLAGLGVAGVAYGARAGIVAYRTWAKNAPKMGNQAFKKFAQGGFEREMSPKEATQILAVRQTATKDQIQKAHKKLMVLNHPDRGGSELLATKINEAKDLLLKKKDRRRM